MPQMVYWQNKTKQFDAIMNSMIRAQQNQQNNAKMLWQFNTDKHTVTHTAYLFSSLNE